MRKALSTTLPQATVRLLLPALVVSCSNGPEEAPGVSPSSMGSTVGSSSSNSPSSSASTHASSASTQPSSASTSHTSTTGSSTGGSSTSAVSNTGSGSSAASSNGSSTQPNDSELEQSGSDSSTTGAESGSGSETSASSGGSTDTNGSTSTGGSGTGVTDTDNTLPMNNAPVPSDGCENVDGLETLTTGGMSVSGGLPTSTRLTLNSRDYIIDIPEDYDPNQPYRLIFSWHQAYGSANGNAVGQYPANTGDHFDAQNYAYCGLRRAATAANDSAIFVAPQGITDFPWDYARDVVLFDDLLEHIGQNLCIDESRVFTTGFSFGAMMSHALSRGRQDKLRAAVTMAPANFNFDQPDKPQAPFAYMGVTGMSDTRCPWVNGDSTTEGGKYCVLEHAVDNGCTIPNDIMTAMTGSRAHVCYDFEGCAAGYPVKVCTFDGNHTPSAVADGMSGDDDGLNAFVPPLAWEFISQF
jgi:poly(3-hydroxybutyrate) depolymerase